MKAQKILVIVGPTATGKSDLAVKLAKQFNGEIISADSRQVYIGLDIGTGKISKKEMRGVKHHLLDVASPKRRFTVIEFQEKARRAISLIGQRGNLPIIVGGTGFYISALVDGVVFPDVPPNLKLRTRLSKQSPEKLFETLKKLDPKRATSIDKHNARRLIRAIEIASTLGQVPSVRANLSHCERLALTDPLLIGLTLPKEELKKRIAVRLSTRIRKGMIAEARKLHTQGLSWKRLDELGLEYRYVAKYLKQETSKNEMILKLQTEIWRYAKRQMTWFKRDKRIQWFSPEQIKQVGNSIRMFLKK